MLHGLYLTVYRGWQRYRRLLGFAGDGSSRRAIIASWCLTMICVLIAHVFFRAKDVASAVAIISAMVGQNGIALPGGFDYPAWVLVLADWQTVKIVDLRQFFGISELVNLGAAVAIVLFLPNLQQWMRLYPTSLHRKFNLSWLE